jgi:selenide,water dikinase
MGILSTAQKRGLLRPEDAAIALSTMVALNKAGQVFGGFAGVKAMTDVTGFGLLGHLAEMCEGSGLSAQIDFAKVPVVEPLSYYLRQGCIPGGTARNWESCGNKVSILTDEQRQVLADPQTSGGLLVAVSADEVPAFERLMKGQGFAARHCRSFGVLNVRDNGPLITVN